MDCKDRPELVGRLGQCAALRGLAASPSLPIASTNKIVLSFIAVDADQAFIAGQTN
jgi:hypothetical protein